MTTEIHSVPNTAATTNAQRGTQNGNWSDLSWERCPMPTFATPRDLLKYELVGTGYFYSRSKRGV